MRYSSSWLVLATVLALYSVPTDSRAGTASSDSLSFQGKVTDEFGDPIDTSSVSILFKIYKDDAPVWEETHPSVAIVSGVFDVILGQTTSLDTVAFNGTMTLGITIGTDSEIVPRTPLVAAAFAKALPGFYTHYRDDGVISRGYNVVGGSEINEVDAGATGATIAGGGGFFVASPQPNRVLDDWGTIGGGFNNTVDGSRSTICGGTYNTASDIGSFVGGGYMNTAGGESSTVGGGTNNNASGERATISGGGYHTAVGNSSTVGGGFTNAAEAEGSTVGGGAYNVASGPYATSPGGGSNAARGSYSFAAGRGAKANHDGSFVWGSSHFTTDTVSSTAIEQFVAQASGGFTFYTKSDLSTGAELAANLGSWASLSDADSKTGFGQPEPGDVLQQLVTLPIQTWRYKGQDESIRHMGPTAQDFHRTFGLGYDDKHIVTIDADGVAFAAIQGLYELVHEQQKEISRLRDLVEGAQ